MAEFDLPEFRESLSVFSNVINDAMRDARLCLELLLLMSPEQHRLVEGLIACGSTPLKAALEVNYLAHVGASREEDPRP